MTTRKHVALNWANINVIEVNNTGNTALTQELPAAPSTGQVVIVKDWSGTASNHTVTILGIIDQQTNYTLTNNYQSVTLYWDNIQWNII